MTSCLDEATILAVGRGTVQGADRLPIEEHVAECDECRSLVSAVARGSMLDLVSVLGEGASPKPPSVTVPLADSQVLSERVARVVPRSGIEHTAPPAEDPDEDDNAITNVPPPPVEKNPLALSAPPAVAVALPVPPPIASTSTTPEIIPTAHPAPKPFTPVPPPAKRGTRPLGVGVALMVLLAGMAADLAFRRARPVDPPAPSQRR